MESRPYGCFAITSPGKSPWAITRSSEAHLISVFVDAIRQVEKYAYIGAFDSNDQCIGYCDITQTGENVLLTVYGDDELTPEKDGTAKGELITFKAFNNTKNTQTELFAEYSRDFKNCKGLFAVGGLSAITGFKQSSTGISESGSSEDIRVYPNPAKDEVSISLTGLQTQSGLVATLLSAEGRLVKTISIHSETTNVFVGDLLPGIYILKIHDSKNIVFKRLVIQ